MKPIRRFFGASVSWRGTTFTRGFPALAMMKASPFAALSMSRDRCVSPHECLRSAWLPR
ncbi:hypothetical protein J2W42_000811 [Rhizobium tibeticum]|nr:hypothetical protein [Rhizobium tibeticum]